MHLEPDTDGKDQLSKVVCGEAKVLGVDLTLLNRRDNFMPKVDMGPDKTRQLVWHITLAKCKS